MGKALLLTVMIALAYYLLPARTAVSAPVGSGPGAAQEPSAPAKVKFSVGKPETVISFERMKEVDVRGIDGSLYALNDKGQWKWFGTNCLPQSQERPYPGFLPYGVDPADEGRGVFSVVGLQTTN